MSVSHLRAVKGLPAGPDAEPVSSPGHRGKAEQTLADLVASGASTCSLKQGRTVLGVGEDLSYELAKSGEFPGLLRLGRLYRVSIPALCQYVQWAGLPARACGRRARGTAPGGRYVPRACVSRYRQLTGAPVAVRSPRRATKRVTWWPGR